jgi:hypothetical protein
VDRQPLEQAGTRLVSSGELLNQDDSVLFYCWPELRVDVDYPHTTPSPKRRNHVVRPFLLRLLLCDESRPTRGYDIKQRR